MSAALQIYEPSLDDCLTEVGFDAGQRQTILRAFNDRPIERLSLDEAEYALIEAIALVPRDQQPEAIRTGAQHIGFMRPRLH